MPDNVNVMNVGPMLTEVSRRFRAMSAAGPVAGMPFYSHQVLISEVTLQVAAGFRLKDAALLLTVMPHDINEVDISHVIPKVARILHGEERSEELKFVDLR